MTKSKDMNRKDVSDYARNHKDADLGFLFNADQDYVAARCCIINGLFSGFALASQAIERTLKAFIYLESGEMMTSNHNPFYLKEKLKKIKNYDLDKFDATLKKLNDHYQSRYHDNKITYETNDSSSKELTLIDELWLDLKNKLPIPNEVKYRTMFFCDLFESDPIWKNKYWLLLDNISLQLNLDYHEKLYLEILKKLYPDSK